MKIIEIIVVLVILIGTILVMIPLLYAGYLLLRMAFEVNIFVGMFALGATILSLIKILGEEYEKI